MNKQLPRIGVGLLVDDTAFNQVRELQLALLRATGSMNGLKQPPHITILRPFTPRSLEEADALARVIDNISAHYDPIDMKLDGYGNFSDKVLYLGASETRELEEIHRSLFALIRHDSALNDAKINNDSPIFHVTLAQGLKSEQFKTLEDQLPILPVKLPVKTCLSKIGIFTEIEGQWVVTRTAELGPSA